MCKQLQGTNQQQESVPENQHDLINKVSDDTYSGPQTMFDLIHADIERNYEAFPYNNKRYAYRYRVWKKLHNLSTAWTVAQRRWRQLAEPFHTANPWKYIVPATMYCYWQARNSVNGQDNLHRVTHEVLPTTAVVNQSPGHVDYHTIDHAEFFKLTDWTALNRVEFNNGSLVCDFEPYVTHQQTNFFVGLIPAEEPETYSAMYEQRNGCEDKKPNTTYFISGENYHTLLDKNTLKYHQKTFCQDMESLGLTPSKWKTFTCNGFFSRWDTLPMRMESLFGGAFDAQNYHKKSRKGYKFYNTKLFGNTFNHKLSHQLSHKRKKNRPDSKKALATKAKYLATKAKYLDQTSIPALAPVPKNHEISNRHERLGAVWRTQYAKETLAHHRLINYRMADTLMKFKQLINVQLFYDTEDIFKYSLKNFFINPRYALNDPIKTRKPGPSIRYPTAVTDDLTSMTWDEYLYTREETQEIKDMPFYDRLRVDVELPIEGRLYEDLNADVQDFFTDRQHDLFHNIPADPTGSGEFYENIIPEPDSPPYRFMSLTWLNDFSVIPEFQQTLFKYIDKKLSRYEQLTPNSYLVYRHKHLKDRKWWQWPSPSRSKVKGKSHTQLRKLRRIRAKIYVGQAPSLIRRVSGYTWPDMTLEECRRIAQYMFNPFEPSRASKSLIQVEIKGQTLNTWSLYNNLLSRPDWCALQGLVRKPLSLPDNATEYFFGQPFSDCAQFVWGPDPKVKYNYKYLHNIFLHPMYPRPIDDHLVDESFVEDFTYTWVDRSPEFEPYDDDELETAIMPFDQEDLTVFHNNYCYGLKNAPAIEADYYFIKEQLPGFAVKRHLPTYDIINSAHGPAYLSIPVWNDLEPLHVVRSDYVKPVYSFNPISKLHNHHRHRRTRYTLRCRRTIVVEYPIKSWRQIGKAILFCFIIAKVYKWTIYNANPFNNTMREWLTVFHTDTLEHWTCKDRVCMHNSGVTFQEVIGGEDLLEQFSRSIYHLRCLNKPFGYLPLLDNQGREIDTVGDAALGYLLVGPPGTGKTFVARAVADTAGVPVMVFGRERFPEYTDPDAVIRATGYIKKILELTHIFEAGRYYAPSIVFIDEIDSVAPTRYTRKHIDDDPEEAIILMGDAFNMIYGADPYRQIRAFTYWNTRIHLKHPQFDFMRTSLQYWQVGNATTANLPFFEKQTLNFFCDKHYPTAYVDDIEQTDLQPEPSPDEVATLIRLLIELDGMNKREIVVIGSTNRPAALDPAVLRPGRLNKILYLDLPDSSKRFKLIKAQSQGQVGGPIDWYSLTQQTAGFSPAHLDAAMNVSRLKAIYNHVQQVPIKMAELPDSEAKTKLHTMQSLKIGIQDTISPWTPYKRAMIRKSIRRLDVAVHGAHLFDAMNGYKNLNFASCAFGPKRIQELYDKNQPIILDHLPEGLDVVVPTKSIKPAIFRSRRIRRRLALQPEPVKGGVQPNLKEVRAEQLEQYRQKISKQIATQKLFAKAYKCLESGDTSALDHLKPETKKDLLRFAAYAKRVNQSCLFISQLGMKTPMYNMDMFSLRPCPIYKRIRGQLIKSNIQLGSLPSPIATMVKIQETKDKMSMFQEMKVNIADAQKNHLKDSLAIKRGTYYAASKALIAFLVQSDPDNARYFSIWDALFDEPETTRVQQRQIAKDITRQCRLVPDFEDQVMIALAGRAGESFMLCNQPFDQQDPTLRQSNLGITDQYLANCIADIMVENNLLPYSSLTTHVAGIGVSEEAAKPPKDHDSLKPIRKPNEFARRPLEWWGEKKATSYELVEDESNRWEEYTLRHDPVVERLKVVGFHYDYYNSNTLNNSANMATDLPENTCHIDLKSEFEKKFFSLVAPNFNALLHQQVTDHRNNIIMIAMTKVLRILDSNRPGLDYIAQLLCSEGDLTYRELQAKLKHFFDNTRKGISRNASLEYLHHLEYVRAYEDAEVQDGCSPSFVDPGYDDGYEERFDPDFPILPSPPDPSRETTYDTTAVVGISFDPGFETAYDLDWDWDDGYSPWEYEQVAASGPTFDPGFDIHDDYFTESESEEEFEFW